MGESCIDAAVPTGICLTDQALLVALLQGSTKAIAGNSRVPFAQIRAVRVRRSLVPFQYIVTFYLQDEGGDPNAHLPEGLWLCGAGGEPGVLSGDDPNHFISPINQQQTLLKGETAHVSEQ